MKTVGIIPARLQSSRLPEKALADICGLPMVIHTCKRSSLAEKLHSVFLATDSDVIRKIADQHNIKTIMTSPDHPSGSDRIAEAAQSIEADVIVNIQGDEPLVDPAHIDAIITELERDDSVKVALGVTEYSEKNSISDIKAVLDLKNNILYCSRSDLPSDTRVPVDILMKMCFVVAFRKEFLLEYASWEPTPLEQIEYNEYLRILEHGEKIRAVKIQNAKISVDTENDLAKVRQMMLSDPILKMYS